MTEILIPEDLIFDLGDKKYHVKQLVLRKIFEGIAHMITDKDGKVLATMNLEGDREDVAPTE